jgi:dimethylargininase
MFKHAITRKPGMNFGDGITTANLSSPSYDLIIDQHKVYVAALRSSGMNVIVLDAHPDYPDAYFVEDTAVVTPQIAVITNPGAEARKGEVDSIEPVLSRYRKIARIRVPGTLDGGDVLIAADHCFIGISERTNPEGAKQLGHILEQSGYKWTLIPVTGGLHLKSSVNYIRKKTLLCTREFAARGEFNEFGKIVIDDDEEIAANTLWVNDSLLMPEGFPKTKKRLETLGLPIIELDVSEAQKMDGGLTCMSIRF